MEVFNPTDLINGVTVNHILTNINKDYQKTLNNSNSVLNRVANWNILIDELKKININITQDNKNKIVNGNQDLVVEIISQIK